MKQFILCLMVLLVVDVIFGLPVTKNEETKTEEKDEHHEQNSEDVAVSCLIL